MSSSLPLLPRYPEETGSNGCVICSSVPDCPVCERNQRCVQSTQTCFECPKVYCKTISTASMSSSSGSTVGGVAGGVIGGVSVLLLSGYLFYHFYLKKKLAFKKVERAGQYYEFDGDEEINFYHRFAPSDPETSELEKPSSRSSFATVFTRASNIIPIAYIPGVTIGTNQNKSNIRASTVSDAGTFDSEMTGDRFSKASIIHNPSLTTTAIRAKPRLITVNNPNGDEVQNALRDGVPKTAVGVRQLGGVKSVKIKKRQNFGLQEDLIEEEEEDGSDPNGTNLSVVDPNLDEYDPFIIDDDDNESIKSKDSHGSVILEVEMDTAPHDPFDDKFQAP